VTSFWRGVIVAWMMAAVLLLILGIPDIAERILPDPDDSMRLLQVRDWLGGQSWWDVTQYRLAGGAMHWSRLVDLPIAAVILATRPLLGASGAELAALILVPLLTLFAAIALVAVISRRVAGHEAAGLAVLLFPLSVPLMHQLRPLRIDHHGWQVVAALAALHLLLARPSWRGGALMGLCLAVLVTISLEGLPIAIGVAGIAAAAWALEPWRRGALLGLVWAMAVSAGLLHLATHGARYQAPMCDAITPAWLAAIAVGALGATLVAVSPLNNLFARVALLALAGTAALATLLTLAPECVGGPFAQLDPLTRAYWFQKVDEGLPIWRQELYIALGGIGLPIVGLIGGAIAWRRSAGTERTGWSILLAAQSVATLIAVAVMRADATANAFALPGAAFALLLMLRRARAIRRIGPRVAATLGAFLIASPGLAANALLGLPQTTLPDAATRRYLNTGRAFCRDIRDARVGVRQLPAARLFSPLDIAPDLIANTPHRAIASGHHRNHREMRDVILAFTGDPATARSIVTRYRADYLIACPGQQELELYRTGAPQGLWARLERGERFAWLRPVALRGTPLRAWRVVLADAPLPAAP